MSEASKTGQVSYIRKGEPGKTGPLVYPAGEYSPGETYTRTELSAPVVLFDGEYYVLGKDGSVTGINPKNDYAAHGTKASWIRMQKLQYAFVEVLMANFAKLASAVFSGDFMFSQYGKDGQGKETNEYQRFNPDNYGNSGSPFTPNMLVDWMQGKLFGLKVEIQGGKIGGFELDGYNLKNEDGRETRILIEHNDGSSKTVSALGSYYPSYTGISNAGYHEASGQDVNRALMLRSFGSTFPHSFFGGNANLCVDAVGGCDWRMNSGDHWCMPGFLCWTDVAINYNGGNPTIQHESWGNGLRIYSVGYEQAKPGAGEYQFIRVKYYSKHGRVRPLVINCSYCWNDEAIFDLNPIIEESNGIVEQTGNYTLRQATITFWNNNRKYIPRRFIITFFGEPDLS